MSSPRGRRAARRGDTASDHEALSIAEAEEGKKEKKKDKEKRKKEKKKDEKKKK